MRTTRLTAAFKRDYKRKKRGQFAKTLEADLQGIVAVPAADGDLSQRHHDHRLAGQWKDHRDCHVRPALVPIYRKPDASHLDLVRLGSHSELGF